MKDKHYLNLAIEAAITNPISKLPKMGAVYITPEGDIFVGRNRLKTHPLQAAWGAKYGKPKSIFLHAEIDCLIKAIRASPMRFEGGGAIWVARVGQNACTRLARPCSVCMGILLHFGVEKIEWTN